MDGWKRPSNASELLREAYRGRRDGRPLDARKLFIEAVARSREDDRPHNLVRALKGLAQIERDLDRGEAARPYYAEAVALCRKLDDPLLLAHTVRHLGDLHREAGCPQLAEPCYREALELYRGHEETHPIDLANALRPLAILYDDAGEMEAGASLWQEARELYAVAGIVDGVNECEERLERPSR